MSVPQLSLTVLKGQAGSSSALHAGGSAEGWQRRVPIVQLRFLVGNTEGM